MNVHSFTPRKQCASMGKWLKTTIAQGRLGIFFSNKQKEILICIYATTWMDIQGIMPCEKK